MESKAVQDRFSGHESFVCRYGWLRKLYDGIAENPTLLSDDAQAMMRLGIGRNMVKSIAFWGTAFGLVVADECGLRNTDLADAIFGPDTGIDPYLESPDSLWVLHWRLTTGANLGAWNALFRDAKDVVVTRARLHELTKARAQRNRGALSPSTIEQHVTALLNTYVFLESDGSGAVEETFASQLQELGLLRPGVQRGKELTFRFEVGPRPTLSAKAFGYALLDYWQTRHSGARSLPIRDALYADNSPGIVFRLDEPSFDELLDRALKDFNGRVKIQDTVDIRQLALVPDVEFSALLQTTGYR